LTNSGYIDYTLNCIESLKKIGSLQLQLYVIGKDGYDKLKEKGYSSTLIKDEKNSNFQTYQDGNWGDITFYKFQIIYENLLKHKYVCFTDGDIVFQNNNFMQYLQDNIASHDMLIQSEGLNEGDVADLCTGFMFIKSNETTLSIFNPENVRLHKREKSWDDQVYINEMMKKINYKELPLSLFPNGRYYYYHTNMSPYLIHFNWVKGHDKYYRMKMYGKWYIDNKDI
jgi:hypothetical protein